MSSNLIICSAGLGLIIIISMVVLLIKKKISVKFALVWIILFTILLLSIIIPGFLEWMTSIAGFQTASNMILSVFIAVLVAINIASTIVISRQGKRIAKLTQEIAIINKALADKNEK